MSAHVIGGCLCGAIRYECTGPLGPAGYCHCADCRKCTGSAFNLTVRVEASQFRLTQGRVQGFTRIGESGNALTRFFCPDCGSPLYGSAPRHPDWVWVTAGSFDDPAVVRPTHQIWM